LLAAQLSGLLIILLWVLTCSMLLFVPLKLLGVFRVPEAIELAGLDVSKHGGAAYEDAAPEPTLPAPVATSAA